MAGTGGTTGGTGAVINDAGGITVVQRATLSTTWGVGETVWRPASEYLAERSETPDRQVTAGKAQRELALERVARDVEREASPSAGHEAVAELNHARDGGTGDGQ